MALGVVGLLLAGMLGCGGSSQEPSTSSAAPTPVPAVQPAPPPMVKSPYARAPSPAQDALAGQLRGFLMDHGRQPDQGWMLGHVLLALGPDATLADGRSIVEHLLQGFATSSPVPGGPSLDFAAAREGVPLQPHDGLFLKVFADIGVDPQRQVEVGGDAVRVGDLFRSTLYRTWMDGSSLWTTSYNDTPWVLQGLASWAPTSLSWTAQQDRSMTLDALTHALAADLVKQTAELKGWRSSGAPYAKRGQGIFAYTCGGAHMLQGVGHAVGRGFGGPGDQALLREEADLQLWRLEPELAMVDAALEQAPQYTLILAVQRLKFLGHHIETVHRLAAVGLVPADDEAVRANLDRAEVELERTVKMLRDLGVYDKPEEVRKVREQTWLDLFGDSAHALRGLDLASGRVGVPR